jgi:DNA-binding MarR family transcriptional regulator
MDKNMELTDKLMRLQWLMHKKRRMMRMAEGPMGDTTRGQGRLLALLKIKDGISTRDLSYLLGARVSSMNELLAKMEKSGYIMREASEDDKRVMLIRLTEKGRDQQVPRHAAIGGLFNCLSAEEQDVLGGYLDRITDALEEEIGPGDEDGRAADWMRAAKERMGDEQFESFVRGMRAGRFFDRRHDFCAHRYGPGPDEAGDGPFRHGPRGEE